MRHCTFSPQRRDSEEKGEKKITAQNERYLNHIGVRGAQSPLRLTSKEGKKVRKKLPRKMSAT